MKFTHTRDYHPICLENLYLMSRTLTGLYKLIPQEHQILSIVLSKHFENCLFILNELTRLNSLRI